MRAEVKTCSQVRIMLDMAQVKNQRWITNGQKRYCQITLANGKVLDLEKEISDLPLEPEVDISKSNKFLNRLTQKIADKEC